MIVDVDPCRNCKNRSNFGPEIKWLFHHGLVHHLLVLTAVLTCTHNLCFAQNIYIYISFFQLKLILFTAFITVYCIGMFATCY